MVRGPCAWCDSRLLVLKATKDGVVLNFRQCATCGWLSKNKAKSSAWQSHAGKDEHECPRIAKSDGDEEKFRHNVDTLLQQQNRKTVQLLAAASKTALRLCAVAKYRRIKWPVGEHEPEGVITDDQQYLLDRHLAESLISARTPQHLLMAHLLHQLGFASQLLEPVLIERGVLQQAQQQQELHVPQQLQVPQQQQAQQHQQQQQSGPQQQVLQQPLELQQAQQQHTASFWHVLFGNSVMNLIYELLETKQTQQQEEQQPPDDTGYLQFLEDHLLSAKVGAEQPQQLVGQSSGVQDMQLQQQADLQQQQPDVDMCTRLTNNELLQLPWPQLDRLRQYKTLGGDVQVMGARLLLLVSQHMAHRVQTVTVQKRVFDVEQEWKFTPSTSRNSSNSIAVDGFIQLVAEHPQPALTVCGTTNGRNYVTAEDMWRVSVQLMPVTHGEPEKAYITKGSGTATLGKALYSPLITACKFAQSFWSTNDGLRAVTRDFESTQDALANGFFMLMMRAGDSKLVDGDCIPCDIPDVMITIKGDQAGEPTLAKLEMCAAPVGSRTFLNVPFTLA